MDGETWRHYGEELERNLQDLSERLKRGAYRAKPVRRMFMPKADGRQRPLGVTALEDKIVQRAAVEVLNAIYGNGLSRIFVRVPTRAKSASSAGCARHRTVDEKSELECSIWTSKTFSMGFPANGW